MTECRVHIDPLNPGQFFACCGLLDLMTLHDPTVIANFERAGNRPRSAQFVIQRNGEPSDLRTILRRLKCAVPEYLDERVEPAVRPVTIPYDGMPLVLDWWLNEFRDRPVSLKCWAGQVTTKNLFSELLPLLDEEVTPEGLFDSARMTKAKLGVDPRSAWNALDFGFSPDKHGRDSAVFPAVEVLASIGLQSFRPDTREREKVCYALWQTPLPASVARQAFRNPWDGLPAISYEFAIRKRGQSYKYFTLANETDKENPGK